MGRVLDPTFLRVDLIVDNKSTRHRSLLQHVDFKSTQNSGMSTQGSTRGSILASTSSVDLQVDINGFQT
jgi:hypothetical protein